MLHFCNENLLQIEKYHRKNRIIFDEKYESPKNMGKYLILYKYNLFLDVI